MNEPENFADYFVSDPREPYKILKPHTADAPDDADAALRLECLSIAAGTYGRDHGAETLVSAAEAFYNFVKGIKSNEGQA